MTRPRCSAVRPGPPPPRSSCSARATIVYALNPTPAGAPLRARRRRAAAAARRARRRSPPGSASPCAVLWLAALGVRERRLLDRRPLRRGAAPAARRVVAAARVVLFAVTSLAFALVESTIHWRAGLGWHGIALPRRPRPPRRDPGPRRALRSSPPRSRAALEHVLRWMRRTVALLRGRRAAPAAARLRLRAPAAPGSRRPPRRLARRPRAAPARRLTARGRTAAYRPIREGRTTVTMPLRAGGGSSSCRARAGARRVLRARRRTREMSPPVALAKRAEVFTLAVPTEEENATTTTIELTPARGLRHRLVRRRAGLEAHRRQQTGDRARTHVIQKVTWTGGSVPTEEARSSSSSARPSSAETYTFTGAADLLGRQGRRLVGRRELRHARADDRGGRARSAAAAAPRRSPRSRSSSAALGADRSAASRCSRAREGGSWHEPSRARAVTALAALAAALALPAAAWAHAALLHTCRAPAAS